MGFAPEPAYGYRRNPDSVTRSPSPQVRQWRGISYVHIIGTLLAVSSRRELSRRTRISIARHVLHELLCFVNLLRKDVENPQVRARLARAILDLRAWPRAWGLRPSTPAQSVLAPATDGAGRKCRRYGCGRQPVALA